MKYNEIEGNLITLAQTGHFDVITHGCNCFCRMGAGIAPQMANAFHCDKFELEKPEYIGDINKLGNIDYQKFGNLYVVNSYTQYHWKINGSKPIDYEALTLCMRKINNKFSGKHIGLPKIGAGLAGGDWTKIKNIIQQELVDCITTIIIYDGK
jgi:O-acetyl-ADP-ribose deacetylase (regulator of RNase III)